MTGRVIDGPTAQREASRATHEAAAADAVVRPLRQVDLMSDGSAASSGAYASCPFSVARILMLALRTCARSLAVQPHACSASRYVRIASRRSTAARHSPTQARTASLAWF